MRLLPALLACVSLLTVATASAETRVFIVANQADAYGVDQCLAKGDKCGEHAARSYCQSRDFAQATSYRRADPIGAKRDCKLPAPRLWRIRRHHMPALKRAVSPQGCLRNDVTLPAEAAM
jgi:hypothetical protein